MRARVWTEYNAQRVLNTPEGPMFAYRDEVVVVAVVRDKREAAALIAILDKPEGTNG